ncbi:MAG: hypothetical protein MUE56_02650 [Ignavibacteria bacterium]|jgi:hypothetical protein|nr:hypothetical protein [Ignavibacteria bacterium]
MKNKYIHHLLHAVVLVIGLILMIGGIITGKHGATVGGIIVAAVNVQQWMKWYKENNKNQN